MTVWPVDLLVTVGLRETTAVKTGQSKVLTQFGGFSNGYRNALVFSREARPTRYIVDW